MPDKYQNLRNNIKDVSKNCPGFGDYYGLLGGDGAGYCFGLVYMWGQAVLAGGEPTLFDEILFPKGEATYFYRLDGLTRYYPDFPGARLSDAINLAVNLRRSGENPSEYPLTPAIESIRAFLDGLLIYHCPENTSLYKEKTDKSLFAQNAIESSKYPVKDAGSPANPIRHHRTPTSSEPRDWTPRVWGEPKALRVQSMPSDPPDQIQLPVRDRFFETSSQEVEDKLSFGQETFVSFANGIPLSPSIKKIYDRPFVGAESEYAKILEGIINSAEKLYLPFFVHLGSVNHSVGLTYYNNSGNIELYNANTMITDDNYLPNMHRYKDPLCHINIAHSLFNAFNLSGRRPAPPLLAINITVYCSSKHYYHPTISALFQPENRKYRDIYLPGMLEKQYHINTLFLYIAFCYGHAEIMRMLLQKQGIKVNQATNLGATPLYLACQNGLADIVRMLLQKPNIEVNQATNLGVTPLCIACQNGHAEIVRMLLDKDALVNKARTTNGTTPLYLACRYGHAEIVRMLLQKQGINVNKAATTDGVTPLFLACYCGHANIVRMLLDNKGALVNEARTTDGVTPLFLACESGHAEIVRMLLDNKGALVNEARTTDGVTPLFLACESGHAEIVRMLLDNKGALVNEARTTDGATPLYVACRYNRADIVRMLLDEDALVNKAKTTDGATPFFIACQNGHTDIVRILLNKGAFVNEAGTIDGVTPLYIACQNGHADIVPLLLRRDAFVRQAVDINGETPLMKACFAGHADVVKVLLRSPVIDVNQISNIDIDTMPDKTAVQALLGSILAPRGVDIKQIKKIEATPLVAACLNGHDKIIGYLLDRRAVKLSTFRGFSLDALLPYPLEVILYDNGPGKNPHIKSRLLNLQEPGKHSYRKKRRSFSALNHQLQNWYIGNE